MAAKQKKRKPRERLQAQGLLDAHKEARAKGGVGAPTREILAYPIDRPEPHFVDEFDPYYFAEDDIPF